MKKKKTKKKVKQTAKNIGEIIQKNQVHIHHFYYHAIRGPNKKPKINQLINQSINQSSTYKTPKKTTHSPSDGETDVAIKDMNLEALR
jgi:hypothetical protein